MNTEKTVMVARNYTFIAMLFVAVLLISNIVSTKIVVLWPFTFDGGTVLFPLSYIFWDILTEVYWYAQSRKIIRWGFICNLLMALCIMFIWALPADASRWGQDAYMQILWLTPRLVVASLLAYIVWEFTNSYILAKMKIRTKWKYLWMRTIWSTIFGELVDTWIFILIAFWGVLDNTLLRTLIISNYLFKVWIEVILTPITYKITNYLKKKDNIDHYDTDTNFNPLKV